MAPSSRKRTSAASPSPASPSTALPSPPAPKRAKPNSTAKAPKTKTPPSTAAHVDENSDAYWELTSSGTRRATVHSFKGTLMVSVREYYGDEGKRMPGKKGISLPVEQWRALMRVVPQIEEALAGKDGDGREDEGQEDVEVDEEEQKEEEKRGKKAGRKEGKGKKRNYDATSEEEEEEED